MEVADCRLEPSVSPRGEAVGNRFVGVPTQAKTRLGWGTLEPKTENYPNRFHASILKVSPKRAFLPTAALAS